MPKPSRLPLTKTLIALSILAIGYFVVASAGDTIFSQRVNTDADRLEQEVERLEADMAKLEAVRDYLRTDEYIEGAARNLLGLVRPGESLVIVSSNVTPAPESGESGDGSHRPWWEKLYGP